MQVIGVTTREYRVFSQGRKSLATDGTEGHRLPLTAEPYL